MLNGVLSQSVRLGRVEDMPLGIEQRSGAFDYSSFLADAKTAGQPFKLFVQPSTSARGAGSSSSPEARWSVESSNER